MKFHEFKISGKNLTPAKAKPFETFTPWAAKLWPLPILLLATLVRLYGSTASAIWCDEGSSLLMSQYSPSLIWIHSAHDVHPPLYFLLLHLWIGAFGDSLFSIRFLSVLTGIGTVGLGMWLVYQVATRHAAIVAGVLLALLPIAVRYSQEVRMYSLMGLWLLGATLALVYWVRKPERHRYLVIYVLLMTASFYTHYFTGLCALSHWAYLTVVRSEKRRLVTLPAWWVANSFIVILYAPWIPGLIDLLQHLDQLRAGGDIGWIEPITMASLPSSIWQDLILTDAQELRWPVFHALPLALVLITGAVCLRDRSAYRFNVLLAIYTFVPLIVVFLALAALYESWSIPFSVMLVVPIGVVGALLATDLRGLSNDVYFQVGLLTTMGLSAKNAILIVEFAVEIMQKEGKTPLEAAVEAAQMRLRPILMTSLAFILGVIPLAISNGAGSGAQNAVGTGVIGGMLAATVLAIYFVPVFFVLVENTLARFKARR